MPQASATAGTALAAEGVSVAYGRAAVVEDLDLAIPPRAFTALIGSNGSGKSTILRTLGGLLSPRAGRVLLDGRPLSRLTTKEIARGVGMLAQGPVAPEGLTVLDLVRQGRYPHLPLFGRASERDEEACAEALALTGMTELAGRPLDNLSGGQRQRAWIAMTLAQETPILLLDEPTTFLDLAHQIEVMELLSRLVAERGKTVVAVLHDLNQAARHADHIVLLKAGAVVAAGGPEDVVTAERIADVFSVAVRVVPDPVTATPMCIPLPLRHRQHASCGG
ncbi:cobalamin/Fe(3+)-siderophore ABC transporter ATP-binding protein [Metarhizobium album]|uniref:Cobalamin/Fe(3+)-siderophore ABC transporter ATP-binding protein n=1 Tax=Metarhizobium album TaxID=2182425 RepID=A0A2U2DGU2_9HYPH|nr:ABC transporter ATP-binding protein [Rhizobium album]PWE52461.1 cobalamin/Fe(3+)-siderophore ABC transporter ATP-binding protein [Rhizobium album]